MVKFYVKGISIDGSVVTVDYEIILSNSEFEGAIGGGRSVLPLSSFGAEIDNLKQAIENHIEQNLGMSSISTNTSDNIQSEKKEDPL